MSVRSVSRSYKIRTSLSLLRAGAAPAAGGVAGCWAAALNVKALKKAPASNRLRGADEWPLHYRIGLAQQQLGRNDDARAAYKRHLASWKGQKSLLDEARKRLEQLGS